MPEDFDAYAADYEALLAGSLEGFGKDVAYYRRRKAAVVKALGPARVAAFLEYGCGIGANLPFLRAAYPQARAAGCDVSAKSLEAARQALPWAAFCHADETPAGAFDLVFVSNVLHHVPPAERPAVAAKAAAALAPGGHCFVFEHNPLNPVTRRIVSTCPFDADAVLLPAGETSRLLAQAGLTAVRRRYTLFFPASLARLDFLEPLLSFLPLGGQYCVTAVKP